jgi:hypothetical protein
VYSACAFSAFTVISNKTDLVDASIAKARTFGSQTGGVGSDPIGIGTVLGATGTLGRSGSFVTRYGSNYNADWITVRVSYAKDTH